MTNGCPPRTENTQVRCPASGCGGVGRPQPVRCARSCSGAPGPGHPDQRVPPRTSPGGCGWRSPRNARRSRAKRRGRHTLRFPQACIAPRTRAPPGTRTPNPLVKSWLVGRSGGGGRCWHRPCDAGTCRWGGVWPVGCCWPVTWRSTASSPITDPSVGDDGAVCGSKTWVRAPGRDRMPLAVV
jgi:hypothetical protein